MNAQILSFYRLSSRAASRVVLAISFLVLMGWLFGIPALKSILPGLASMKANTALTFMLAGVSLWQVTRERKSQRGDGLAKVFATISIIGSLISILALIGYVYSATSLFRLFPYSSVAIHIAFAVFLLCLRIMKIFNSTEPREAQGKPDGFLLIPES